MSADKIRALRNEKRLTQEELAQKLNISRPMVAQLERGTKVPTLPLAARIAEVFNCSLEDLL